MKILVVDDEITICELLHEFLSQQGYEVHMANRGEEAISTFEEMRPELVLLDIKMEGMTGIEVLRKIKEMGGRTGVVMLSAFGDADVVHEAIRCGADYYIEKPLELMHLKNILSHWRESVEREDEQGK